MKSQKVQTSCPEALPGDDEYNKKRNKQKAREQRKLTSGEHFVNIMRAGKVDGPPKPGLIPEEGTRHHHLIIRLQQIAEKKGGKFLGVWRENNNTMGRFICKRNHAWTTSVSNIQAGSWCWNCGHGVHDYEQCRIAAEKRMGKCLRTWQERGETYGEFVCGKEHPPWIAEASQVLEGKWCKKCAIDKLRVGIDRCRQFARKKGGICLPTEYLNDRTKLHWKCSKGHDWWANLEYINRGYWCPRCARKQKHNK